VKGCDIMLSPNQIKPLFEQLRDLVRNDIINGKYTQGEKMPSEDDLGKLYGVSRITVRRALQELCDEGMLIRRQGKGTFVLTQKHKNRMDLINGFTDYMQDHGRKIRRIILEKKHMKPSEDIADSLQINMQDSVIYVKRLMIDGDIPFMIDECWYPFNRFPHLFEDIKEDTSTYQILSNKYNVNFAKSYKEMNACLSTEEISNDLGCAVGEPIFSIQKIVYDIADIPVQISKMAVIGSRVTYTMTTNEAGSEMQKRITE